MKTDTNTDIWRKNLKTQGTKLISPIQMHTNHKCNGFGKLVHIYTCVVYTITKNTTPVLPTQRNETLCFNLVVITKKASPLKIDWAYAAKKTSKFFYPKSGVLATK